MNDKIEKEISRHSISIGSSIREALRAINELSGEAMTLFAVGEGGELVGTLTDGDIRRGLIAGGSLDDGIEDVINREYMAVRPGDDIALKISEGRRRKISMLPVLRGGRIERILDLNRIKTSLPIDAVLMAGGKGERLRPLTLTTPKPLLPVGGKAIIDYNVEELEACGVEDIYITVNYLAEQIEGHFNGRGGTSRVECVREPKRLGTIGSLALIGGLRREHLLLMNSDLLTTIDFAAMYEHHVREGNDITIAGVPYNISVPYALLRLEGERVVALQEKPTYNYFANGGVYLMKRSLIERLPKGEYMDAPDFISTVISEGGRVGYYPIDGIWIDIGSPDDYRYANEIIYKR